MSSMDKRDLRAAGVCAYISAPLFFLAAVLNGAGNYIENESRYTPTNGLVTKEHYLDYTMLNTTLLRRIWKDRISARGVLLAGDFFGCMGWFALIPPIQGLALVVGGDTTSTTRIMTASIVLAATIAVVEICFEAGTTSASDWVATWPSMTGEDGFDAAGRHHPPDEVGYSEAGHFSPLQALEISYVLSHARAVWLLAMDDLLLAIGLSTSACLAFSSRQVRSAPAVSPSRTSSTGTARTVSHLRPPRSLVASSSRPAGRSWARSSRSSASSASSYR